MAEKPNGQHNSAYELLKVLRDHEMDPGIVKQIKNMANVCDDFVAPISVPIGQCLGGYTAREILDGYEKNYHGRQTENRTTVLGTQSL